MEYCRRQREVEPRSPARLLFARAPLSSGAGAAAGEVPIIDDSVYSRNRCFRVAFSSKFGQRRPLRLMSCGGSAMSSEPGVVLLHSLASFVSGSEPCLCARGVVAGDADHSTVRQARRFPAARQVVSPSRGCSSVASCEDTVLGCLVEVLVRTWGDVRSQFEPGHAKTGVLGSRLRWTSPDRRYLCVSLRNNRFCLCKGASHKSNNIYLVVNVSRALWYQKCHDVECRSFKSMDFSFSPPGGMLPSVVAATSWAGRGEATSFEPAPKRRRCAVTP